MKRADMLTSSLDTRSVSASMRSPCFYTPAPTMPIAATRTAAITGIGQVGGWEAAGEIARIARARALASLGSAPSASEVMGGVLDVAGRHGWMLPVVKG